MLLISAFSAKSNKIIIFYQDASILATFEDKSMPLQKVAKMDVKKEIKKYFPSIAYD